jgi:hypothetical protein
VFVVALAGCASEPLPGPDLAPPMPEPLAAARDLRGAYRAALCQRDDMTGDACDRTLYRFAGEPTSPRPPTADAANYRLLLVPGFIASCFPEIRTFGDILPAAEAKGFAVDLLAAEGRNGVAANARLLGEQVDRLPADGRRLIFVGHSKGATDVLALLVERPDIASRTAAVLSLAGALHGSPLADRLDSLYRVTFGAFPFSACNRGEGDAVADMQRTARKTWWAQNGPRLAVPIYSLVTVPEFGRIAAPLYTPFLLLSGISRYNDGMLLARDQVAPGGALLGIVDSDHLSIAIPRPDVLPYMLWVSSAPFPRPQAVLAAIDVIAADKYGAGTTPHP